MIGDIEIKEISTLPFKQPKKLDQVNIAVELAMRFHARRTGYKLHFEYSHERSRFDCIVHDDSIVYIIIEIKTSHRKARKNTKQMAKYKQYNVPIILISNMEDVGYGLIRILNTMRDMGIL